MTTVAKRTFRSSPHRDAHQTWTTIVELLTQGRSGPSRTELLAVAGVAASVIADQAPQDVPIVVTCNGPRTRIYCLYGEDAVEGGDANEDKLGFDPLNGDWNVSLPCPVDDLAWVQAALKVHTARITAREPDAAIAGAEASTGKNALVLNMKEFLDS